MELPKRIKPLDPQLVNRIAAGEIIQRPFNALKELIENCLDAGSTSVNIQLKDGGLKSIQIQDNGCGIDKDDLKIVCERFTTSKLKEFEDLKSINTFGFRGEALASISHISRLTITSRTANSQCAFRATYSEGKLVDSIKPCASASKGTVILVEDLFYNSSIRRNALRNGSEEFSKIFDVVSRYAIHNYHVSFFLKRIGESSMDLKTNGCQAAANKERCEENETVLLENIGIVYGNELKKELERIVIEFDELLKFEMSPCYFRLVFIYLFYYIG
jgi:DNA mismatch repair protein MLH1